MHIAESSTNVLTSLKIIGVAHLYLFIYLNDGKNSELAKNAFTVDNYKYIVFFNAVFAQG